MSSQRANRYGHPKPWSLRPLSASTFGRAAKKTVSHQARAEAREAEWPRLATAILNLPEGLRARPLAPEVKALVAECAAYDFDLGLFSLQAMTLAFRVHQSEAATKRYAEAARFFEEELVALSLTHSEPAQVALQMPNSNWSQEARVITGPEPRGVVMGRAE